MSRVAYVDSSALVRLVIDEAESQAMFRWFVEAPRLATSRIGVVETLRAAARQPYDPAQRDKVVEDVDVIEVSDSIGRVAARLEPPRLPMLDAIHLATALALVPDLGAFVTYDDRLAEAARAIGLPVVQPA